MASNPTRDLQEEFLSATRKSQETVVRAIKTWAETVRTVTPKMPDVYVPFADRLPKLPSVTVAFADKLPKPEEVVASSYDFAEHLLSIQRKFAEELLDAMVPLIPGTGQSAGPEAPTAKSWAIATAPQPTAPKAEPEAPAVAAEPGTPAAKSAPKPAAARQTAARPAAQKHTPAAAKPAAGDDAGPLRTRQRHPRGAAAYYP